MPDFEAMDEDQLKAFRLAGNLEIRRIRDELREAGLVLERIRGERDRIEREAGEAALAAARAEAGSAAVAAAAEIISPPAAASGRAPEIGA